MGAVGLLQAIAPPVGLVTVHVTAPLGRMAPVIPDTEVVRVVVPSRVGFDEAARVIVGICLLTVKFKVELEIDA
jgi:hypothetical protein